jgi:ADP-heptose:LPS heptosyltransferase
MLWLLLTWLATPVLLPLAALRRKVVIRRVLVIQTAKIGDFVSTTLVFRAIKQLLPGAHVTVLVNPVTAPLAAKLDSIDEVVSLPTRGFRGLKGKGWLYRLLVRGFDAVIVLSPNLSTFLLPLWARIPRRISVLPDRRKGSARLAWPLLTYGEPHIHGQLFRITALQALRGLGVPGVADLLALPNEIPQPSTDAVQRAKAILAPEAGPYLGVGISAGNTMKALPPSVLFSLVDGFLSQTNARVVLIGTSEDSRLANEILTRLGSERVIDATGRWTLEDLPALLAQLDAYVGVDSGVTYMADAAGVPVIDIMGPADPLDQRPLGAKAIVVPSEPECAPCSHAFDAPYQCRHSHRACLNVSVADVISLLRSVIISAKE